MNNEEKILEVLTQMQKDISDLRQGQIRLEQGQAELKQSQAELKQSQAELKAEVEMIKEDIQITRNAVNTLLDWAEQAQVEVKIPLYKKAE